MTILQYKYLIFLGISGESAIGKYVHLNGHTQTHMQRCVSNVVAFGMCVFCDIKS